MLKIIFFGTPQFAVPSLQRLLKEPEITVEAVVTQPDKPRGRGKKLIPSAVKKVALEHNLPVWQPSKIKKDATTKDQFRQLGIDAFVVVAYGQILSTDILAIPRLGCINGHGSILPKYRGAAPIQWCLYHGEEETGITTMLMDAGMDTGPMLLKDRTTVKLLDNANDLAVTLAAMSAELLVATLQKLEVGEIEPTPQDDSQATYAPLIQKSDYQIDWSRSALEVHNQIRAFFPNCVTTFRNQPLKVQATIPLGEAYWPHLPPKFAPLQQQWPQLSTSKGNVGEIVSLVKKFGPIVQTGSGLLLLWEVKPAGKKAQSGWDFTNGMRLSLGEAFN